MSEAKETGKSSITTDRIVIRPQVIMLSINGRKPIPLEPKDAANIISELAEALADGRDCEIEV